MKDATAGEKLKAPKGTDWKRLRGKSDAEVHAPVEADPEVHPTDEDLWKDAEVILPRRKEVVTIRLDADLLEWLRRQPGYQTRINAVLRSYMKACGNEHHHH